MKEQLCKGSVVIHCPCILQCFILNVPINCDVVDLPIWPNHFAIVCDDCKAEGIRDFLQLLAKSGVIIITEKRIDTFLPWLERCEPNCVKIENYLSWENLTPPPI